MLTACATAPQIPPTQTPPVATSTAMPPTTTPTSEPPTPKPFENILFYDPPAMYEVDVETVQYPTINGSSETLLMDIFYPPDRQPSQLLPAVILVNGFPYEEKLGSRTYYPFQSWGRLIASEGLIAVAYDSRNENDLEAVIDHIQQNGADLGIDGNKLGFWSMSAHSGLASNYAFQEDKEFLKFAVFYYAWIMTPDNFERGIQNAICAQAGCLGSQLPDVKQLRTDLPLLVVRCGQDNSFNISLVDHFIQLATDAGVPLTLINFEKGKHLFDWRTFGVAEEEPIKIIKQTLEFMKEHAYDP
jgi:hypothetical protein